MIQHLLSSKKNTSFDWLPHYLFGYPCATADILMCSTLSYIFSPSQEDACADAGDQDPDGVFRHGQNMVSDVSTGLLMYTMDCKSPPPVPIEALSGPGDSGGLVCMHAVSV